MVSVSTISVKIYFWLSVTKHKDTVNGSNGYRSRDVDLRFGASVLPQMLGWLVVVGLHFGFKRRMI